MHPHWYIDPNPLHTPHSSYETRQSSLIGVVTISTLKIFPLTPIIFPSPIDNCSNPISSFSNFIVCKRPEPPAMPL